MNRTQSLAFRLAGVAFGTALVFSGWGTLLAQAPSAPAAPAAKAAAEEDEDPFVPQPAVPLPPGMTGSTTNDPRVGLKAGLYDAGEAAMGMEHIAFVKKPEAFQLSSTNPDDPAVQKSLDLLGVGNKGKIPKPMQLVIAQLAFSNSDFAFQGTHLLQGNFYGVNFYDISNPAKVSLITSLVCPGGQGDVSVYGNLLFMSVEMPNGRLDCGVQGFPPLPPPEPGHEKDHRIPTASPDRFRGVRIFDISDIKNPKQVAAVQTCRGSHTHTLVLDPNDKDNVYIYVSGTSFVRQSEELAGCSGEEKPEKDPNTSLFRIDVIKVPVAAPQQAKVVSSPRVFIDPRTGALNGLNNGGSHDKKAETPKDTNQCHDITVYSALGLAAGACSGNGILLDIKDPVHPKRVDAVNDPNYSYWHSASFSNDGTKVVFTDEWGGGLQPRCRPTDSNKWGADAIFNLKDDKLSFASYYKMPAAQTETENCVAHNGSLIPVPGRDIEVQAWYQGGISVMDFTDPAHAYEIAYFDRGPVDAKTLILGGDWSAYWYNGYIYGSEIARGLDVFKLVPSKFLTQNEIDAARLVQVNELNVQNQQRITWPSQLTVARAYVDQLERSQALSADRIADLNKAIARAQKSHLAKKDLAKLRGMAASVETSASDAKDAKDAQRLHELAHILEGPTA
ncbi:LVIVD repeat-containing protein [Tunturiibacter psychrotolerans]|uniref:LVIVD repeat-containing protein n=1 Tax=Tunturiibacter psychrotolerans TaxID=3069686 RepID=UPI003D1BFF66